MGVKAQRRVWEGLRLVRRARDGCGGTRVGVKGLWMGVEGLGRNRRAWGGSGRHVEGIMGLGKVWRAWILYEGPGMSVEGLGCVWRAWDDWYGGPGMIGMEGLKGIMRATYPWAFTPTPGPSHRPQVLHSHPRVSIATSGPSHPSLALHTNPSSFTSTTGTPHPP